MLRLRNTFLYLVTRHISRSTVKLPISTGERCARFSCRTTRASVLASAQTLNDTLSDARLHAAVALRAAVAAAAEACKRE